MSSIYINLSIFSYDFANLLLAMHFLKIQLIGITAKINNNGEAESPWKLALLIFTSARAVSFLLILLPSFYGFRDKVFDLVGYFLYFQTFYYPSLRNHIIGIFIIFQFHPCAVKIFFTSNVNALSVRSC